MHIPDGYLSPSTCAALYATATPFWYFALRRVKRALSTRTIPLLSVFSAFSFVVMMFNLPLPGGTTGHAVGMGIASIVVGPWASILAISTALLIQALLFGDGGLTTYGANCFNMAIVGSLTAYFVYRIVARRASLTAPRRAVAAALAGYLAINLSAFCAAVEFGVQPLWFHTVSGLPLYAPYPLHIAIPAMMIGHLTFAGLAELVLSAGLVWYLQRSDPDLLRATAPDAPDLDNLPPLPGRLPLAWPSARKLWLIVALFLVLTPLGILAAGKAWGEWRAADFASASSRAAISEASSHQSPPKNPPVGLARLSFLWRAPISDYSPSFVRSSGFGYLVSAALGVGAIIFVSSLVTWLIAKIRPNKQMRKSFMEKTIDSLLRLSEEALFAEDVARSKGLLQKLDPRVKLIGFGALLVAVIAVHRLWLLVALLLFAIGIAALSSISLRTVASRVWLAVFGFTGVLALPAIFLTPGRLVASLPILCWPITLQGLATAALLLLRAETAATLILVVILTTVWRRILRSLRLLRIPPTIVVILEMTYRYIFVLLNTAQNLFEARRARLVGPLAPEDQRSAVSAVSGVLLAKSFSLGAEIHLAMQARGFRGEVFLLDDLAMRTSDWLQLSALLLIATLVILAGQ